MGKKLSYLTKYTISVPHLNDEITFVLNIKDHDYLQSLEPPFKGDYFDIGKQISKKRLQRPTLAEIISLFFPNFDESDDKFISKEKFERFIHTIGYGRYGVLSGHLKNLYAFNGILYAKEGIYIQDDPPFKEGKLVMKETDLKSKLNLKEEEKVIYSDDGSIRFVPYGFKSGEMNSDEIRRNPFIIALSSGQENAEKIAYISNKISEVVDRVELRCAKVREAINPNYYAVLPEHKYHHPQPNWIKLTSNCLFAMKLTILNQMLLS